MIVLFPLNPIQEIITGYLTSPENQQLLRDYVSSPEGRKRIAAYFASPEGQSMVRLLLPMAIEPIGLPPGLKTEILENLSDKR